MTAVIKFLSAGRINRIPGLHLFLVLQLLDVLTTMIGFRVGLGEASPFIRHLMQLGPLTGLLASKTIAIFLAGFCIWSARYHVIRYVNYWYGALVVWNVALILLGASR